MLLEILRDAGNRTERVASFQKEVWNLKALSEEFPQLRILRDLALDLDFYQPNPAKRREESSAYGDEQLESKIGAVVRELTEPNKG
jgi:hypothetical protein